MRRSRDASSLHHDCVRDVTPSIHFLLVCRLVCNAFSFRLFFHAMIIFMHKRTLISFNLNSPLVPCLSYLGFSWFFGSLTAKNLSAAILR